MLATKLCALLGIVIASQATALIVETTDVLGRPLQYDELDRNYKWMRNDNEDDHPVNGKYSSYLPSDLGLNTELEIDENDHDSECRVEHPDSTDVLTPNQYIITWKDNVDEDCKAAVYKLIDLCSSELKLGRGVGLLGGFGIVASPNKFLNCIVRNHDPTPDSCHGAGGVARKVKALFKDCDLDIEQKQNILPASGTNLLEAMIGTKNKASTASAKEIIWSLDRIDDKSGFDQKYDLDGANKGGGGVTVYVVDTGVNIEHEEFEGRAAEGWSAFNDQYGSKDCQGHGSHCAGTVAGKTYGVAKAAKIVSVRVLSCSGSGSSQGVLQGYDWVVKNHKKADGPAIISASLGGGKSRASEQAAKAVTDAGVHMIVAAGNENRDACSGSPASAGGVNGDVITVASSDRRDRRSGFSCYGAQCTDIIAPGSSIKSAGWQDKTGTATHSGTSMATPAVAGAAAVFLAEFPAKTPKEVKAYLQCTAVDGAISDARGTPNKFLHVSTSIKQSCLSSGGGGGGGGSGSPPAATVAPVLVPPTSAPVPVPPGSCADKVPSNINLNGQNAECSELKMYCSYGIIQQQCPATCGKCEGGTDAPAPASTDAPVPAPTHAPVPAPTDAPVPAPTDAPVPAYTHAPVPAPTDAPVPASTDAPATKCEDSTDTGFTLGGNGISGVSATCAHLEPFCYMETISEAVQKKCPVTCGFCF